jgi:PKD repeat protein
MYNNGGGSGFDAVSIHPYAFGGPGGKGTSGEGIDYSDLDQVRQVMVDHGDVDKKIWITEYGWNTNDETRRADDLAEVLAEFKQPQYNYLFYAKHLVLNDWDDHDGDPNDGDFCCYGLTDEAFNPKPAFFTFKDFDKTFPDVVEFTADVTAGSAPLTVQFTDQSSVDGASVWLWDFGDGETSPLQHPEHTYTTNGDYTVRLTVTGTNGPLFEEKVDYIRVSDFVGLLNPSYEDPLYFLTGWSSCLAGGSSIKHNPTTHIPTPAFHDGINCAGMSSGRAGDDLGAGAIWQEAAVDPGRMYHVSFWGFITASLGTTYDYANDFMQLRVRDGDGSALSCINNGEGIENNSQLLAASDGIQNPQWLLFEGEFVPTQNVMTVIAYWKFSGSTYMNNSLHLDDWNIVDVTPALAPADYDEDGDVDDNDAVAFFACASGPTVPFATGCADRDFDGDNDVDHTDFAAFQRCITGQSVTADPNCAD